MIPELSLAGKVALVTGARRSIGRATSLALAEAGAESRTPLARWGSPREIALAVLFLASPASNFVTGAALPLDGGWLAR